MINQTAPDTTDEVSELLDAKQISEIKKKTVSGVLSYFVRSAFLQGIGLVSALILSRFFEPVDFAVYGFVTQIIGLLIFFSDVGLAATLIKEKNEPSLRDYRTSFTVQQVLSWVIFGIIVVIYLSQIVQHKFGLAGGWILLSLGISFPLASLKTISSIKLERRLEFSKLVLPQIFEQIIFHGILIYLAWKGVGAMAYAWAILVRSLIGVVVMWLIEPWPIGLHINVDSFRRLLKFGVKFQLNDLIARIKDQLFFLLLGWYLPNNQFGYISWAKNWSMYPYNLTVQNVMSITFPTFARLQKNPDLLKRAIEKSIFFISLFIFPLLVGMCIFISPLVRLIPSYGKWQPALLSFIFFTLSIAWAAITTPLVNTLQATGRIDDSLKLMVMWTILTWILTPILVLKFGFNGVAMAAFVISFSSIFAINMVQRFLKVKVWDNTYRQLIASILMAIFALIFIRYYSTTTVNLLINIVISALIYIGTVFFLGQQKLLLEIRSLKK